MPTQVKTDRSDNQKNVNCQMQLFNVKILIREQERDEREKEHQQ